MQGTLSACLGLPIGCMKFLFTKEFTTIFGLSYTPNESNFFFVEFDWHMAKKFETIKAPQNRRLSD
jgi:hypothetical protein